MWGNLRNTIANAGEGGGLIAKLGDVVAPQSHDEDDGDYEYEEGEEDEEYEYYEEEVAVEGEEEEEFILQNDDQNIHDNSTTATATTATTDDQNQLQFSPGRINEGLNGSRAAMGKLFGGVLQKGKEKLTETARNLVEPDYNHDNDNNNFEIMNGNDPIVEAEDRVQQQQQQQQQEYQEDGNVDSQYVEYHDDEFIGQKNVNVLESEDIVDFDQKRRVDETSIEHETMNQSNLVINDQQQQEVVEEPKRAKNIPTLSQNDQVVQSSQSLQHVVGVNNDEEGRKESLDIAIIHPDKHVQTRNDDDNEPLSQPEFAQEQNNDDDVADIAGMDSMEEFHSFDHDVVDVNITKQDEKEEGYEMNGVVKVEATTSGHEDNHDHDDSDDIEPIETVQQGIGNNSTNDNDLVYVEKEEILSSGHVTAPINTNDLKEKSTASVAEHTTHDENHIVPDAQQQQDTTITTNSLTPPPTSAMDENNQRLPPYEEDQTMENGNDPAAMEILDETIGHAFNLQETGLDKTIGHHLTGQHGSLLQESELNETMGHHVVSTTLLEQEEHATSQDDGMDTMVESEIVTQSTLTQPSPPPPTQSAIPKVDQEKAQVIEAALTESNQKVEEYRVKTLSLETELSSAKKSIEELQSKLVQSEESHHRTLQQLKASFDDDKELLVSTAQETHAEEVQHAVKKVRDDMEKYILDLQEEMATQMEQSDQQLEQFRGMYEEACERADTVETNSKKEASKHGHQLAEMEKRHSIALERVETKAARAIAALEDKDAQIKELNVVINDMKNTIKKNVEEHEAVEDEADELHEENEELKGKMKVMEAENKKLKNEMSKLKEEHGKSLGVQIELQLLREECDREKEKLESLKESQNNNESTLIAERDAAKANALDLEQRLTALQADLDLAKSDYERSVMASSNLQTAMEAFQIEREAELALLEESRISAEEAIKASNDLAMQSLKQENEAAMNEVQIASSKAIENIMSEMAQTEQKLEEYRKETINLRRSLDEAIHRLQTNQEDVIDRSLMKNIFIDWHSRSGKARRDVMVVVASVLHFTESDKDKCGIGEGSSAINKVVGAVAPPLTPAKKTIDELDGDNIREKWVNFLLAECGDSPTHETKPAPKTKSRQNRSTQSLEL